MGLVSPCVGICKLDEATGYCLGCARTGDEIADWKEFTDEWRASVWDKLPERFETLGITCRRLPWETSQIRSFVLESLRQARGTWVAGIVGAVGEFAAAQGQGIKAELNGETIIAETPGARLQFLIDKSVRALTFETKETPPEETRVVLAVKRERGRPDVAHALAALGQDHDAITPADRHADLFDLGLGRKEARFCVRTGPGQAHEALTRALGSTFPANLSQIGSILLEESPTRVIETALGRIEVLAPIPEPDQTSPHGPHTHLLPDHLKLGQSMPAGMELPRAYIPGAIFYPAA